MSERLGPSKLMTIRFLAPNSRFLITFKLCRLEWEMSVDNGEKNFMTLEEERLLRLKEYAHHVLQSYQKVVPKMSQVSQFVCTKLKFTTDCRVTTHGFRYRHGSVSRYSIATWQKTFRLLRTL